MTETLNNDTNEPVASDAVAVTPPTPEAAEQVTHVVPQQGTFWGTGRRKTSVARVRIMPGEGKVLINGREVDRYFSEEVGRGAVRAPLAAVGATGKYNVFVNVRGGGSTGQAGAILLGLSRALVTADPTCEQRLRDAGYMTRDARKVERKKYGHRKARRRFQFSKR